MTITAKPILFSAPMIKALLREIENPGTGKTQTRRIMKDSSGLIARHEPTGEVIDYWGNGTTYGARLAKTTQVLKCPYGKPGDLLWVRETSSAIYNFEKTPCVRYEADQVWRPCIHGVPCASWFDMHHYRAGSGLQVPSIHMPRWASRITLEVTDVRVERLMDISEEDARAEGFPIGPDGKHYTPPPPEIDSWQGYGAASFKLYWSGLHGKESFYSNPWLWAVTFVPHLINVDQMIKERAAA